MSIINTFDGEGAEIIKAENNVHKIDNFPKTILVAFSTKFCNILLNNYNVSEIGCLYGGIMAYTGGYVDEIMMRVVEVLNSIPYLIVTLIIIVVLGNGYLPLMIALCITGWTGTARMVRGKVLQLRESEYVLAAEALGASTMRIIIKHLLPNTIGLIILDVAQTIPAVIVAETSLAFLGLGLTTPRFSLGSLLSSGQASMSFYPYQLLFPTIVLVLLILSFNILGDGLRDALDPKLRQ